MIRTRATLRRGPGLISTLARSVAIAGMAAAGMGAGGADPPSGFEISAMRAQIDDIQAQQVAAATAPRAAGTVGADLITEIRQLARLRLRGILSEAAFTDAKARLLGL